MNSESQPDDSDSEPEPGPDPESADAGGSVGDPFGAHTTSQQVQHNQVSAIVPEHVARGVFSTGAVVLQGQFEFVIDFLLRMSSPQQVAARIILPAPVVVRLIAALSDNISKHNARFGPIPIPIQQVPDPTADTAQQATAQELYDQLKLKDDVISGTYANAVMIGHTATEFSFDFITTFFPRSSVAARVFLASPNVPKLLESLKHALAQYQQRTTQSAPPPPPAPQPPPETDASSEEADSEEDDQDPPPAPDSGS